MLGKYSYIGGDKNYKLDDLLDLLHTKGLFYLRDVGIYGVTNIWNQGWLSTRDLDLVGDQVDEWDLNVNYLSQISIKLSSKEDMIFSSKNISFGEYTTKLVMQ